MVLFHSGRYFCFDRTAYSSRGEKLLESIENRLSKEGNETVTNCNSLRILIEDGKMRFTSDNPFSTRLFLNRKFLFSEKLIWFSSYGSIYPGNA